MNKIPRIFIGGTGRSGTTILYDILGRHPKIYGLKDEIRFIIDYNGLINLVDALTINYSPAQGGRAIVEVETFLLKHLTQKDKSPYPWYHIQDYLGKEVYFEKVNHFIEKLTLGRFDGHATWFRDEGKEGLPLLKRKVNRRVKIFSDESLKIPSIPMARYFSERKEIIGIVADFVDDLFYSAAKKAGKFTWVEKTPYNILNYSFIRELFPDALFIHIKRDPRSVAQSYFRQTWAPNTTEDCALLLKEVFRKWFDERKKINIQSPNYLEVKLEDFAENPKETLLKPIEDFCGLTIPFQVPQDLDPKVVKQARQKLTRREEACINTILKEEILELGYEL